MDALSRKILISSSGTTADAYYNGQWLTVEFPPGINFWHLCECAAAELEREKTVLAAGTGRMGVAEQG